MAQISDLMQQHGFEIYTALVGNLHVMIHCTTCFRVSSLSCEQCRSSSNFDDLEQAIQHLILKSLSVMCLLPVQLFVNNLPRPNLELTSDLTVGHLLCI